MASDAALDASIARIANAVADKIREIISQGGSMGDITVLVRGENVDIIGGPRQRLKLERRPH